VHRPLCRLSEHPYCFICTRRPGAPYLDYCRRVRGYNECLSRQPTTAEEFVAHAALIAEVEAARPEMDREYDHVRASAVIHVARHHDHVRASAVIHVARHHH